MSDAGFSTFPVIALGGSAGGLNAFTTFCASLDRLDPPLDAAFVIIPHLMPGEKSHMAELLQRHTALPVTQVAAPTAIEAGHIYVLKPGETLDVRDGTLQPRPRETGAAHHPVDDMFIALAGHYGERAVAIICSGTGSNGSEGLTKVREAGGVVMAQSPESAGFKEMPQRAIDTGMVDEVCEPAAMGAALVRVAARLSRGGAASSASRDGAAEAVADPAGAETEATGSDSFQTILALLRDRTSIDFRSYKTGTLTRRIDRRISLTRAADWPDYAGRLKDDPEELDALVDDLLITVTGFFRDPAAWDSLTETVIAPLVARQPQGRALRVWVAGCATGAEAYSIALTLFEAAGEDRLFPIELFATDLSETALATARKGIYPAAAVQDLSPDLRDCWFISGDDRVQVKQELREAVVFAPHNLLQDPPFSGIDLVICRNVLIYMRPKAQQKVLGLFHFALRKGGHLFLGNAESIGEADEMFDVVDKNTRIFRRKGQTRHDLVDFPVRHSRSVRTAPQPGSGMDRGRVTVGVTDTAIRALVNRHAPPSVLVDARSNAVFYHGAVERFLKPQAGEPTQSLPALAHSNLAPHLRRIMDKVGQSGAADQTRCRVRLDGDGRAVSLRIEVEPVPHPGSDGLLLVSFVEAPPADHPDGPEAPPASSREEDLEAENHALREQISAMTAQSNRAEEEFKAYNEEVISMNEELRAANEELETSKEELQSLNEELGTVNAQLNAKVSDLNERTADLDNLLSSTEIATIFLDSDLNIRWFSPDMEQMFRIRQADTQRPITDLVARFDDTGFADECRGVLRSLKPSETQVRVGDTRWFKRTITPYRTVDDRIVGLVVTFGDVTAIQVARRFAERIVESVPVPLVVLHPDLRVENANPAFYQAFDAKREETENRLIYDLGNGQWNIPELRRLLSDVLPDNDAFHDFVVEHAFERIGTRVMRLNGRRLDDVQSILLAIEDITDATRAEQHQMLLMEELAHRVKNALGVVQGLSSQTLRRSGSLDEFQRAFAGRLDAYARSHGQLLTRDWQKGLLQTVVETSVEGHAIEPERITVGGPPVELSTKQALSIGLILHELETNAIKYGALSGERGSVRVSWSTDGETVTLNWQETGGPPVAEPGKEGFGSTLIRQLAEYDLGGAAQFTYDRKGLHCRIIYPNVE